MTTATPTTDTLEGARTAVCKWCGSSLVRAGVSAPWSHVFTARAVCL